MLKYIKRTVRKLRFYMIRLLVGNSMAIANCKVYYMDDLQLEGYGCFFWNNTVEKVECIDDFKAFGVSKRQVNF